MKITIFSQHYPPETGAPQARLYELALRLRDMGHVVTVLTAMPNYPTGKIFKGYRWKLRTLEHADGIRVIRTFILPSKSSRTIPRLASAFSFVFSSLLLGAWELGGQDVILFQSPPLFSVLSAIPMKYLTGSRLVMHAADVWPDILIRMGKARKGLALKAMFRLERAGYEYSDLVALTTPGAMAQIKARFPHVRTTVLSNGVDTKAFRPELRSESTRRRFGAGPDDFLVGYIGLHGVAQGLQVAIRAAARLREHPKIRFVMIGDGVEKDRLVAMATDKRLDNLTFYDPMPKRDMPRILASCDASLVPLVTKLPGTLPSKLYEALAAGVPVVVAKHCEAEHLVRKHNLGRMFEPLDDEQLARALLELSQNPDQLADVRRNCVEAARRFDRDRLARITNDVLLAVHEGRPMPEVIW